MIELQELTKRYGERAIYSDFDFEIKRGERWCVMGVNGAGKTTLLKLICGRLRFPQAGECRVMGYLPQHRPAGLLEEVCLMGRTSTFPRSRRRSSSGCTRHPADRTIPCSRAGPAPHSTVTLLA